MSLHSAISILSAFGDQTVIIPFVLIVSFVLVIQGERRAALLWCATIFGVLFAMLIAKIVMIPCGYLLPEMSLRSPSGHAASAFAAYGGFAVLWARMLKPSPLRALVVAAFLIACVGIALSRPYLGAHTLAEILFGSIVGLAAPILLQRGLEKREMTQPVRPSAFLLVLLIPLVLVVAMPRKKPDIEGWIADFAYKTAAWLNVCDNYTPM